MRNIFDFVKLIKELNIWSAALKAYKCKMNRKLTCFVSSTGNIITNKAYIISFAQDTYHHIHLCVGIKTISRMTPCISINHLGRVHSLVINLKTL